MTVKELMDLLKNIPEDTVVKLEAYNEESGFSHYEDIDGVLLDKELIIY